MNKIKVKGIAIKLIANNRKGLTGREAPHPLQPVPRGE